MNTKQAGEDAIVEFVFTAKEFIGADEFTQLLSQIDAITLAAHEQLQELERADEWRARERTDFERGLRKIEAQHFGQVEERSGSLRARIVEIKTAGRDIADQHVEEFRDWQRSIQEEMDKAHRLMEQFPSLRRTARPAVEEGHAVTAEDATRAVRDVYERSRRSSLALLTSLSGLLERASRQYAKRKAARKRGQWALYIFWSFIVLSLCVGVATEALPSLWLSLIAITLTWPIQEFVVQPLLRRLMAARAKEYLRKTVNDLGVSRILVCVAIALDDWFRSQDATLEEPDC